ncbi:MAG TPA: MliC family protein [Ramlibacter sp.]|nr:MliC family protein [Ramlibacter sp.]
MRRLTASFLCTLFLGACVTPSGPPTSTTRPVSSLGPVMTYACDDLTTVAIQSGSDVAVATLNSGLVLNLPLQRAGTGFWFATPEFSFRGRGDEAVWTVPQRAPVACRRRT